MSQHSSNDRATASFTPAPSIEELRRQVEERKRAEQMALEPATGREGNVIQATQFDPFPLMRAQRNFIKAQVDFQHSNDVAMLIASQKRFLEVLDNAIFNLDYRKLAGIQETLINMMTTTLEELGVL